MLNQKSDYKFVTQDAMAHIKVDGSVFPLRTGRMTLCGEDVSFLREAISERQSMKNGSDPSASSTVIQVEEPKFADGMFTSVLPTLMNVTNGEYGWMKPNAEIASPGVVFDISGVYDYSKTSPAETLIGQKQEAAKEAIASSQETYRKYLEGYEDDEGVEHQGELARFKKEIDEITDTKNADIIALQNLHADDESNLCHQYYIDEASENSTYEANVAELDRKLSEKEIEPEEYYVQKGQEDLRHYNQLRELYRVLQANIRSARETLNSGIWDLEKTAFYNIKAKTAAEYAMLLAKDDEYRKTWQNTMRTCAKECYEAAQGAAVSWYDFKTGVVDGFNAINATPKQLEFFDAVKDSRICSSCCFPYYARANSTLALSFQNSLDCSQTTFISYPSADITNGLYADLERMTSVFNNTMAAFHSICTITQSGVRTSGAYSEKTKIIPGDCSSSDDPLNPGVGTFSGTYRIKEKQTTYAWEEEPVKTNDTWEVDNTEMFIHVGTRYNVDRITGVDVFLMECETEECTSYNYIYQDVWEQDGREQDGSKYKVIEGMEEVAENLLDEANRYLSPWEELYTNEDPPFVRDGEPLLRNRVYDEESYEKKTRKTVSINKYATEKVGLMPESVFAQLDACDDKYTGKLAENEENRNKTLQDLTDAYLNEHAEKEKELKTTKENLAKTRDNTILSAERTMWATLFPLLADYNKKIKDKEKTFADFKSEYIDPGQQQVRDATRAATVVYNNAILKADSDFGIWETDRLSTLSKAKKNANKPYDAKKNDLIKEWKYDPGKPEEGEPDERGERVKIIDAWNDIVENAEKDYDENTAQALTNVQNTQEVNYAKCVQECASINDKFSIAVDRNWEGYRYFIYISDMPVDPPEADLQAISNSLDSWNNKNEIAYNGYLAVIEAEEKKLYEIQKSWTPLRENARCRWKFTTSKKGSPKFSLEGKYGNHDFRMYRECVVAAVVKYAPRTSTGVSFSDYYDAVDAKYKIPLY